MNKDISTLYLQALLSGLNTHPDAAMMGHSLQGWQDDDEFKPFIEKAKRYATGGIEYSGHEQFVQAITKNITLPGKPVTTGEKFFFSQKSLSLTDEHFPVSNPEKTTSLFWKAFEKDISALPNGNTWAMAETLLHVIHKYGVGLPSGYQPDVSLYDFVKASAGMAVCLYRLQNDPLSQGESRDNTTPFILIGGGLSGIQHYLFDIASRNAAKNMKGRSYFLHMLSDSVVQVVLDRIGLYQANIVISTGGGFQIIAPNTEDIKDKLEVLRSEIRQNLFKDYKTQLFLEFDWTDINEEHLLKGKMGEAWGDLYAKFTEQKRRKFKEEILSNYDEFFEPTEVGGEEIRDAITVEELPKDSRKWKLEGAYPLELTKEKEVEEAALSRDKVIGKTTAEQIWLGLRLRKSNIHVSSLSEIEMDTDYRELQENEYYKIALKVGRILVLDEEFKKVIFHGTKMNIHHINDPLHFLEHAINRSEAFGFNFYGGNEMPQIYAQSKGKSRKMEYLPKTFSELALQADEDRIYLPEEEHRFQHERFKRLAILRMDVDGLGSVFQDGFKVGGTLTRYAALSRQMDWFFKGHLNEIWKTGSTDSGQLFCEYTQILYSGGDDLFIVGKWNCVLALAEKIRESFKHYTCQSPNFNISGGMVMVTPKFPVARAAKWCEEEEKKAKHHTLQNSTIEKDSFSLFGFPLKWDTEFRLVKNLKGKLIDFLQNHSNHKGILIAFQEFDEIRKEQIKRGYAESWRWQIAYQLSRTIKRGDLKGETIVRELQFGIFFDDCSYTREANLKKGESRYPFLQILSLASRWAEFESGKPAAGA